MLELICSASMGADMGIGCCGSNCVKGPPRLCVSIRDSRIARMQGAVTKMFPAFQCVPMLDRLQMHRKNQQSLPLNPCSRCPVPTSDLAHLDDQPASRQLMRCPPGGGPGGGGRYAT